MYYNYCTIIIPTCSVPEQFEEEIQDETDLPGFTWKTAVKWRQ